MMHSKSKPRGITRRDFLYTGSMAAAGLILGCATNPVTGTSQLMLVSEDTEISMDRQHSPHQFSADYGVLQDRKLNEYISRTGQGMASQTHRPKMPYSFQGVNAVYVNAYAFPGGSIGITRGILLKLQNEAELAALIGHELGHVNARHTASIMSTQLMTMAVVGGVAAYVGIRSDSSNAGILAAQLGLLTSGVLLAKYSRDNERQADELGMSYIVKNGYTPDGMVGLMSILNGLSKNKGEITQVLFATHPMSDERYQDAVKRAQSAYAADQGKPNFRERYMDHTADLRKIEGAVKEMQTGEGLMAKQKYPEAQTSFSKALQEAPEDYAGLLMMAKCQLAQKKNDEAKQYADRAKEAYPKEAQAFHLSGYANLRKKQYEAALQDFTGYETRLPGNPNSAFFKGVSLEGMGKKDPAAQEFYRYLKQVQEGDQAQYAYRRLKQWGYLK
ncbi:MAG: M48 family metalloprotease [Thermodesulfobacteriota bacterium]